MIDVIVLDPKSVDYPVFKKQLEKYSHDLNVKIISTVYTPAGEWRDLATNTGLGLTSNEWVLFLEQDFFWTPHFWEQVMKQKDNYDAIGFWEANRLHPAFLLIKRDWINKTSRDFAPIPEEQLDHFGRFSRELVQNGIKVGELENIGLKMQKDWYHMQGLTHNYNLCRDNNLAPVFKRDEFLTYHKYARKLNPELPDVEAQLGEYKEVDWLKEFLK